MIMENKRSKVFISILLIVLCLSVCVGLTYAYFTDSAKSNGNKIQAGNLKLDLKLYDKVDDEWISIKNTEDPVFNYNKWEPGYVDAKLLKIENLGDLAMQWEAKLVSTEAVSEFANAIEVYVQKSNTEIAYPADRAAALAWTKVGTLDQFINTAEKLANGTFTAQGEAYYIGIALYMPAEITDNTLQGQILGAFDIQINATQLPYESDAFDEKYDDITIDSNGGVTPPDTTESTEDTSSSEPEPTEPQPEPTDPDIFTWSENGDGTYTVTGFKDDVTPPADLVIPSTYNGLPVTAIGDDAFQWCNMTSVTIPEGVTTIGDYAFAYCSNLQDVTVPDSITYVGYSAFDGCNSLAYNEYDNAYYLGNDSNPCVILMKATDTSIESCNIHENTKVIYDYAFKDCYSLTGDLTIPNSVTTIGYSAFASCSGLTGTLTIPNSVTAIGNYAFASCSGLTGTLTIPNSVTTIGEYAFQSCSGLTELTIGNGVTTIGDWAFFGCSGLTGELKIPDSVTTIGGYAFSGCSGLTSITIPDSVTTIVEGAFQNCSGLTEITIPSSVVSIGVNPFIDCIQLTNIAVADENTAYQSIDGNLYSKDGTVLVTYAIGKSDTSFTIPDSVTTIGGGAFYASTSLTSIEIPNSVTTIGHQAFMLCSGLTSIEIPNSVTTIGDYAFAYCSDYGYDGYSGLTSVTIGNGVTTIGNSAFSNCWCLTSITFAGTVEQWNAISFGDYWNDSVPATEVVCSDENVALN